MATDFDIAIIGGGIHGVGVAQAAAAAGYRTIGSELGAELLCPATVTRISLKEQSVTIHYNSNNISEKITCKTVVNAAGPWVNELLATCSPKQQPIPIDLIAGTHIELPSSVKKGCYYLEVPEDKRAFFVMPWKGRSLVGTTEQLYTGAPDKIGTQQASIDYLLRAYHHYFPELPVEVINYWTGLRVLPQAAGSAFTRSRETQLPTDRKTMPRIISIVGGKLTGYRANALKVIKILKPSLPKVPAIAKTDELPLSADNTTDVARKN